MFLRSALFFSLVFCCLNSLGQSTFKNAYGGSNQDVAYDVKPTLDGGYIICGETFTFGSQLSDQYILKLDSAGNIQWTRTVAYNFGGQSNNPATEIIQLTDSSYVYVGYRVTPSTVHANLVKLSPIGDTVWVKTFVGNTWFSSNSIKQTQDGGFVFAGTTSSSALGNVGFCLVKCDSAGTVSWSKLYEDTAGVYFWEVLEMTDNGYLLAGDRIRPGTFERDYYLIRTNSNGDTLWTRTYSSTGIYDERLYDAKITLDGGILLTGFSSGYTQGNDDILLLKLDSTGTVQWARDLGTSGADYSRMSIQLSDSSYIVVGSTGTSFVGKLSSAGNLQWIKSTGYHSPRAVQLKANGQLVVAGSTYVGSVDVYLAITDTSYGIECGEAPMFAFCNDVTSGIIYGSSSPQIFSNLIVEVSSPDTVSAGGSLTNICLTGLHENEVHAIFDKVYPVPANTELLFESNAPSAFSISDGLGRVLMTGTINVGFNSVDVSSLPNGVYFLHATSEDGRVFCTTIAIVN